MIINKKTLSFLTRSDKPNENWTGEDCYIVQDGSDLAKKIISNYPNIEYVIENDKITDVKIVIPETPVVKTPTAQEDTDAMLIDHEYRLTMLELGVNK